jgi:hypothetical protein
MSRFWKELGGLAVSDAAMGFGRIRKGKTVERAWVGVLFDSCSYLDECGVQLRRDGEPRNVELFAVTRSDLTVLLGIGLAIFILVFESIFCPGIFFFFFFLP